MLKNDEYAEIEEKEAKSFLDSKAFVFASFVGFMYVILIPICYVIFSFWIIIALFWHFPGCDKFSFIGYVLDAISVANFIVFVFFLFQNKSARKTGLSDGDNYSVWYVDLFKILGFIIFIVVSMYQLIHIYSNFT